MPDAVTAEYIYGGHKRRVLHLTNLSDSSGESAVVKADISTITYDGGKIPTYTVVDRIEYNIQGFTAVKLEWDHDTNDEIALLPQGANVLDWYAYGGKVDPRTTGGTGDIILTTEGEAAGATYDISIYFRAKG